MSEQRTGDGIIKLHNGREYRIRNAWGHSPGVFVRYLARGMARERKLPANTIMATRVVVKFREEILSKEDPLVTAPGVW